MLRTHCCRHKRFAVCPRAQHKFCVRDTKMFLILFRNILCPQQMFPSLRSPRNIMGNNVSATMCPRLPGPLELSHYWFPVWQCDFRSKKSRELLNSIMTSDDASEESEFLSAVNASLESFVHKALKDEQIECIHKIVCHGRDVLAVLPTGLGKSAIYQLISKAPHQKPPQNSFSCFLLAFKVERYLHQGGRVLQNKPYFCRPYCTALHFKFTLFVPCVRACLHGRRVPRLTGLPA